MNRELPLNVVSNRSICDRKIVQKAYGNEALNRSKFLGGILDLET